MYPNPAGSVTWLGFKGPNPANGLKFYEPEPFSIMGCPYFTRQQDSTRFKKE